jgi:hypothetical protein
MGKKIQSNFKGTAGAAEFSKNALQSFTTRLRFSPELNYVMPAQVCFAHKVDEPYEYNGKKYDSINSVLMLGVDTDGDVVDIKVVPVSNLSRMYFDTPEVEAIEKDGHIRGAVKMLPASEISSIIAKEGEAGRRTTQTVAFNVKIQRVYIPTIEGNANDGYDFKSKDGKLELDAKEIAIFETVGVPKNANYESSIPEDLKQFMK